MVQGQSGVKRRDLLLGLTGIGLIQPTAGWAQAPRKVYQIGFLYPGPQPASIPRIEAFSRGIQSAGFPPEQFNIVARVTEGDLAKLAPMAAELVARKVDLILAVAPAAIRAAQAATRTIPIVVSDLESDPVASGFVISNAKPGGNITGCFLDFPDFSKKWFEALKEAVGQVSPVGVFWDPAGGQTQIKGVQTAADNFETKIVISEVRTRADVEPAFNAITKQGARALIMLPSPFLGGNTKLMAGLALKHKLPSVSIFPHYAADGGLMAYGPEILAFFHQQGGMAAKILRGTKPADLPIETPTKFEFVLNMKTAKLLGVTIPPTTMLRADKIID